MYHKTYAQRPTKRETIILKTSLLSVFALLFLLSAYSAITTQQTQHQEIKQLSTSQQVTKSPSSLPVIVALPIKYAKTQDQAQVEFEIRTIAKRANFQWPDYLVRLALYESGLNPSGINDKNRNGSIDYGLYQWNSKNPPIAGYSISCYMSLECSTKITMDAINRGYQHHWMANQITINNK